MMTVMITKAAVVLGGVFLLASGSAAATSFRGSCSLSGTVAFAPSLTAIARTGQVQATGKGRCSDGRSVTVVAQSRGLESCAYGRGTGSGYLDFGDRRLAFSYSELRAGAALLLEARGNRGGSALAQGNVSFTANPLSILEACATTGLTQAPIDIRLLAPGGISG